MKGKLLIATPELLTDNVFSQSVILITDYHDDGTVGFILNKPLMVRVNEVTNLEFPHQLYNGGPVSPDRLYYIHKIPDLIPGGYPVYEGLYWGGNLEELRRKSELHDDLADKIKFFIGYSGWSKGQLEEEIRNGAWLVSDKKIDPVNVNPKTLWKELLVETAPEMELWKNAPLNPELN
ncbi:MAG: YqgE/AlgH family protein [Chlorobi bacterium]|nr:YqgE/AlgH family protein [Chlorobiota bacterium]